MFLTKNNSTALFNPAVYSGCLGTVLEWYDFSIYAYLAAILAPLFFPKENSYIAIMLSYSVFAVGYLVRPLGATVFGHLGDTIGRKKTLTITIVLMAIATVAIGLLPTFQQIGVMAPVLLVGFRLLQGLAVGGESFGSSIFVVESADHDRKGFVAAITWAGSVVGMLLGSFTVFLITSLFHGDALNSFGWRIPFLLGIISGVIGYYIRSKTVEPAQFVVLQQLEQIERLPLKAALTSHKGLISKLSGMYLLSALITYLVFVFMPLYLSTVLHYSIALANALNSSLLVGLIILDLYFGSLSDRFNKQKLMLFAAAGFILLSYPLYYVIAHGMFIELVLAQILFVILAACYQGPLTGLVIDVIPTRVRYTVGSLGYNLTYAIFGGTAPLTATFLIHHTGNTAAPGIYLALGACVALIALLGISL